MPALSTTPSPSNGCICCHAPVEKARPYLAGLLQCGECSHVWADVSISDEELERLYSRGYFEGEEYLDYEREAPALEYNFRKRLDALAGRHPDGARLWEVGAAYGFFLRAAQARGFQASGCDISQHAASFAREALGLDVRAVDYLDLPAPGQPYDVICLWDTVEHLRSPDLYLEKAFSELRPGGNLALSTGDIGALNARLRGRKWRLIHPPSHLHYFTSKSMNAMLGRIGFQDVSISHPAFWRSLDAVAFRLLAYPPEKRRLGAALYRALQRSGLLRFYFPLNTFDLMSVIATK